MKKKTKQEWKLDPKEVSCGMHSSSSGKTGQFERKLKTTSCTVFLTHTPTGIKVEGQVPPGNYSKKEMKQKRGSLAQKLFCELEVQVSKHLRIKER